MMRRSGLSAALSNATKNTDSQRGFNGPESTFPHNVLWNGRPNNGRPEFPFTFIHLSPGLILLVFFGLATRSFGSDMASSISEEGTALVPLWLLWDVEKEGFYINRNTTLVFFLFVLQVIIFQCISRLPTSSLGLSWLFRRPPLVPEGAVLGVVTHLNGAAQMSSSAVSASWASSSAASSTSESLSSSSDSAPPSSSSSSSCAKRHQWLLLKVRF